MSEKRKRWRQEEEKREGGRKGVLGRRVFGLLEGIGGGWVGMEGVLFCFFLFDRISSKNRRFILKKKKKVLPLATPPKAVPENWETRGSPPVRFAEGCPNHQVRKNREDHGFVFKNATLKKSLEKKMQDTKATSPPPPQHLASPCGILFRESKKASAPHRHSDPAKKV